MLCMLNTYIYTKLLEAFVHAHRGRPFLFPARLLARHARREREAQLKSRCFSLGWFGGAVLLGNKLW